MQHPEEGIIHAWLDGALPANEAAVIESHVASCADCAAAVADARGLIAASSRIVGHLDAVPGKVIPAAPRRRATSWRNPWFAAAAAGLILFVGYRNWSDNGKASRLEQMVASPEIARPTLTDSATVRRPRTDIVAQEIRGADQKRVAAMDSATSLSLPPANAAIQKSSVPVAAATAAPPPPMSVAPAPTVARAEVQPAETRATTADAGRSRQARPQTGSVAGGVAAAAPSMVFQRQAESAADLSAQTFTGCYEMNASTGILPARFALAADSAGPGLMAIHYLDAEGRSAARIVDLGWAIEGDVLVVKTQTRETLLTLRRAGSAVVGDSRSGSRNGRVTSCSR